MPDIIEIFLTQGATLFTPLSIFLCKLSLFIIISLINIIKDIKEREVYPALLIPAAILALVSNIFISRQLFLSALIGTAVIVTLFLMIYFISALLLKKRGIEEGIGLGDMLYLALYAALFGHVAAIAAFLFSFWLATLILILPYLLGKIKGDKELPFVPFIFAGSLLNLLLAYLLR